MNLFDKLKENHGPRLSPKAALALAAMTVVAADGEVEENEVIILRRLIRGDETAYNQAYKLFKSKTFSQCVEIVNQTLDETQKTCVLANLLDIVMADGVLAEAEKKLIDSYLKSFQISDAIVKRITEIVEIKNKFSIFD